MVAPMFPQLYDVLPPIDEQRGSEPNLLFDELLHAIRQAVTDTPRSKQRRPGPSVLGTPCARRIGYHLTETEPVNIDRDAWKPTVGRAVHAWLEETLMLVNQQLGTPRYLMEFQVDVGTIGNQTVTGNCDVYDRVTASVIDWKILGDASLKRYRLAKHPGEQYRTQLHLYGRGWERRGMPVDTVHIVGLPQNASLRDAWHWHESYDASIAEQALLRADTINTLIAAGGPAALPLLPTADAYCAFCPFWLPASTEITSACPGHHVEVDVPLPAAVV